MHDNPAASNRSHVKSAFCVTMARWSKVSHQVHKRKAPVRSTEGFLCKPTATGAFSNPRRRSLSSRREMANSPELSSVAAYSEEECGSLSKKCMICEELYPQSCFPEAVEGSRCEHDQDVCGRCWSEWLDSQVSSVAWDKISCCQCPNVLEQSELRNFALIETFEEYGQS